MGSQLESDMKKLFYSPGKDTYWEQATLQTFLKSVDYENATGTDCSQGSAGTAATHYQINSGRITAEM